MNSGKHLSIKNTLLLVFIALSLTTGGIIAFISFSRGFQAARDAVNTMNRDMNTITAQRVREFLAVPAGVAAAYSAVIGNGLVSMEKAEERELFFRGILETYSGTISGVFYEMPQGERYGVRKNAGGGLEFLRPDGKDGGSSWYSPESGRPVALLGSDSRKESPWFREVLGEGKPAFSTFCGNPALTDPAVSAVSPVYGAGGKPLGVIGTRIPFSSLDAEIKHAVQYEGAFAAVFDKKNMTLLASSLGRKDRDTPEKRDRKEFSAVPAPGEDIGEMLTDSWSRYQATGENSFVTETPGGSYFLFFSEYIKEGLEMVILTALPENLLAGPIKRSARFSGLLMLLSQVFSVTVYMMAAKKLLTPVTMLVRAAEEFAGGKLLARAPVVRDDEIGLIARSFNSMADTVSNLFINLERIVEERTGQLQKTNRELEEQTRAASENRNKLKLLLDSTGEAVFGIDLQGNCTFCNRSFLHIMGYSSSSDLKGSNMHSLIHYSETDGSPIDSSECRICLSLLTGEEIHADNEVFRRSDGSALEVEYHSYPQFVDGEIVGAVVTFTDNSEKRKSQEKISYLSTHDALTGLHNRGFFGKELLAADREDNLPLTVIFGDINGLKLTNDVFGHSAGDELLKAAADMLKKSCRGKDVVARLGGDEFAVIMTKTAAEDAERIIRRIRNDFAKERIIAIRGSISMGYGTKTSAEQDITEIGRNAEEAMYREKTLNRKDIDRDMANTIMETLHEKSPREKSHSRSMADLCGMIGDSLGMSEADAGKLKAAGYLHDIGKVVLDQDALNRKDGMIEEEDEKKEMLLHPAAGFRILNLFDATMEYADWILCHHENWDGSGFPKGIGRGDIPLQARILRAAEVWERLRLQFLGSPGWEGHAVRELRRQAGTVLDPKVVEAFVSVFSGAETLR